MSISFSYSRWCLSRFASFWFLNGLSTLISIVVSLWTTLSLHFAIGHPEHPYLPFMVLYTSLNSTPVSENCVGTICSLMSSEISCLPQLFRNSTVHSVDLLTSHSKLAPSIQPFHVHERPSGADSQRSKGAYSLYRHLCVRIPCLFDGTVDLEMVDKLVHAPGSLGSSLGWWH